jgi:hypothetical protein
VEFDYPFNASQVQPDHYRYFQVGTPSMVNSQADFALLHLAQPVSSSIASAFPTLIANLATPTDMVERDGYPIYNNQLYPTIVSELFSVGPAAWTAAIQYTTPEPANPGFTGSALWPYATTIALPGREVVGIETAGGFGAEVSQPTLKILNSWIAADHSGTAQPSGAIAVPIPALFEPIRQDPGAPGVDAREAALVDMFGYQNNNPDVAAAGIDPALHFATFGWHENRAPNPLFDPAWYLQHNPDVAASGMDPLLHYLDYGVAEARSGTPSS